MENLERSLKADGVNYIPKGRDVKGFVSGRRSAFGRASPVQES